MALAVVPVATLVKLRDAVAKETSAIAANKLVKVKRSMYSDAFLDGADPENIALKVRLLKETSTDEDEDRQPFTCPRY